MNSTLKTTSKVNCSSKRYPVSYFQVLEILWKIDVCWSRLVTVYHRDLDFLQGITGWHILLDLLCKINSTVISSLVASRNKEYTKSEISYGDHSCKVSCWISWCAVQHRQHNALHFSLLPRMVIKSINILSFILRLSILHKSFIYHTVALIFIALWQITAQRLFLQNLPRIDYMRRTSGPLLIPPCFWQQTIVYIPGSLCNWLYCIYSYTIVLSEGFITSTQLTYSLTKLSTIY